MSTDADRDFPVFDPEFAGAAKSLNSSGAGSATDLLHYPFGTDMGEFDTAGFLGVPLTPAAVDATPEPLPREEPAPQHAVVEAVVRPRGRSTMVMVGLLVLVGAAGAFWYMRRPHAFDAELSAAVPEASPELARTETPPLAASLLMPRPATPPVAPGASPDSAVRGRTPTGLDRPTPAPVTPRPSTAPGAPIGVSTAPPGRPATATPVNESAPESSGDTSPPPPMRVLKFPRDESIGAVYVAPWNSTKTSDWDKLSAATDTVPIMPATRVHLIIDVEDLSPLDRLPAHGLDQVTLKNSAIDDEDIEHLKRFTSLTQITISEANVSEEAKQGLHAALPKCTIR